MLFVHFCWNFVFLSIFDWISDFFPTQKSRIPSPSQQKCNPKWRKKRAWRVPSILCAMRPQTNYDFDWLVQSWTAILIGCSADNDCDWPVDEARVRLAVPPTKIPIGCSRDVTTTPARDTTLQTRALWSCAEANSRTKQEVTSAFDDFTFWWLNHFLLESFLFTAYCVHGISQAICTSFAYISLI